MSEEIPPGRMPKCEFVKGHFYCDGIKVQPSLLTSDEIRRFIPKPYWTRYFKGRLPCPLDGCSFFFEPAVSLKRSFTAHFHNNHKQWYVEHGKEVQACEDYAALARLVDRIDAENRINTQSAEAGIAKGNGK